MKRAVAWELVTAFAFLGLVALHAEGERRDGWATRLVHGLLDPDRVPPHLTGAALLLLSARWLAWTRERPNGGVSVRARARALGGALVGLAAAAVTCWWLVGTPDAARWSALRPALSRELLRYETVAFALVAVALATAPAGLLARLAGRPVHAVLAGATLSLGSYFCMNWSCRWEVGWGRAVLLGTGLGLGLALGAPRRSSSPSSPVPAADDPVEPWLLLALVATIGWPGRSWLLEDGRGSALAQLWLGEEIAGVTDFWILQTLIVCHLARAWRLQHRRAIEVALCAGVALQLTLLVARLTPATVASALAPGTVVAVRPPEAFVLTTWGLLTLGALWLRTRSPRDDLRAPRPAARADSTRRSPSRLDGELWSACISSCSGSSAGNLTVAAA